MNNYNLKEIAERLKNLRELMEVSAAQMAEATSLSEEEYAVYEHGESDFSFNFLFNCAKTLNCDITELITGDNAKLNSFTVTRKGEGLPIIRRSGFNYLHLASNLKGRKAEPFVVNVPYDAKADKSNIILNTHEGQEMDFILKGSLKVCVDGHTTVLNEGDCIYYYSSKPHGMVATGGKECSFMAIVIA